MTLEVEIDSDLLQRAKECSGLVDETVMVRKGLELLCRNESDAPNGRQQTFDFDRAMEKLEEFPELSEESAEAWKAELRKPNPPKW